MLNNALQEYIDTANARTQAWVDEVEGRWATTLVSELEHWAKYDIHTVDQLKHHMAAAEHYDFFKEVNGIRPRWMRYDEMTLEEIEDDISRLANQYESESEYEQWFTQMRDENHKYNDLMLSDPEPTKYELIAEAAGY